MRISASRIMYLFIVVIVILFHAGAVSCAADNRAFDPNQIFYAADRNYELREYQKALDGYLSILSSGLESGGVYYNIGNCYLKMGQLGRAILYYGKAKRLIPNDSDLKANLSYAISLVESSTDRPPQNFIVRAVNAIFGSYSLRAVIFSATVLYLILLFAMAVFILKPLIGRRFRIVLFFLGFIFLINLAGVAVRYFDERIARRGVVVVKEVECKYEPIEKSTTFYNLREGRDVAIVNTRDGWRQVRRPDGKVGWVKKEAVEEI